MEAIFINEQEVVKRFSVKSEEIKSRGASYNKELESRFGINSLNYIHEFGNVFWREDKSLDENINYLLSICATNYLSGMFALFSQLKAENERDLMALFLIKAGFEDLFRQFKQNRSNEDVKNELRQLGY